MRAIVFDTSTIITLSSNNLLWVLKKLKEKFNGKFLISDEVKKEVVDVPLKIKRFELKALQVLKVIKDGVLESYKGRLYSNDTNKILDITNNLFYTFNNNIKILHGGEASTIALAKNIDANAIAIDERTARVLVENPLMLANHLSSKLHTKIKFNSKNLELLKGFCKGLNVIRSSELVWYAERINAFPYPAPKKEVLDSLLWAVKLAGCAISKYEIEEFEKL